MKYIKQVAIIFAVTCVGEILKYFIPLPIPASIYGLVIMIILLATKVVKLEQVKDVADFLIEIMPLMFIPAGVGIIVSWKQVRGIILPVCVTVFITTCLVMIVTGKVTDFMVSRKEKRDERNHS
jgi:holin-like protein